jgi:hypothetical protein
MVKIDHHEYLSEEEKRLKEDRERVKYWKKWGPYVAERQWATGTSRVLVQLTHQRADNVFVYQSARITVPMVMPGAVSPSTDAI